MKEALTALALMTPAELPAGGLEALRWDARPVLVFAEAGDVRLDRQLALFAAHADDLVERRTVVIVDRGGPEGAGLRARVAPERVTVVLVGLDGGEKLRADRVVAPDALDALIDRMPMRRRELRARSDG